MSEENLWIWFMNSLCSCEFKACVVKAENENNKVAKSNWSNVKDILWLLHSFRPDLISPSEFNDEEISKINSQKLLKIAECELGIPRLLDKSETESIDTNADDDLPFFTYLAIVRTILDKTIPRCHSFRKSSVNVTDKPSFKISRQHFLWCPVCQTDVSLFERFFVDENVRHRKCFVCHRCNKRLHVGLYRPTKNNDAFECLEHEKEDLVKKLNETTTLTNDENVRINGDVFSSIETETEHVPPTPPVDPVNPDSGPISSETSTLCSRLSADVDKKPTENVEDEDETAKNLPKAPPRKKKVADVSVPPATPVEKPLPAVRTKLKPKIDPIDDVVLRKYPEKHTPSSSKPKSTNPFGSDDEFDDDSVSSLSSDNPFNDSDYDSELAEANRRKSLMVNNSNEKNRSTTRADLTKSYTAGVSTNLDVRSNDNRSNSRSPLNSSTKKRPAPQPPPVPPRPTNVPLNQASKRKKRPAPPRPLPFRRQIRSDVTMSPDDILTRLNSTDNEFTSLEQRGRLLEDEIRMGSTDAGAHELLMEKWLALIRNRIELIHQESEFAFLWRERQLDELHAEIEYQLRCIIEKPESEKREDDGQKEAYLLQKLLRVIDEKSRLAESDIAATSPHKSKVDDLTEPTSNLNLNEEKEVKKKKHKKLRLKKLKQKLLSGK